MGLREKRLGSDMRAVMRLCAPGSSIQIVEMSGSPADRYQLRYSLPGLVVQDGAVVPASTHLVEVYLTLGYPRQAPQCRMLTPIFHPNIAPHAICVGDHWSAGESLAALLLRIAEMICYQSYNVKSPLNGDAARWAESHARDLPLLRADLAPLLGGGPEGEGALPAPAPHDPEAARPEDRSVSLVAPAPPDPLPPDPPPPAAGPAPGGITCDGCGASLALAPGWSSRWARCPMCGRMIGLGG
jgi:ubiquitin-protein ligase